MTTRADLFQLQVPFAAQKLHQSLSSHAEGNTVKLQHEKRSQFASCAPSPTSVKFIRPNEVIHHQPLELKIKCSSAFPTGRVQQITPRTTVVLVPHCMPGENDEE